MIFYLNQWKSMNILRHHQDLQNWRPAACAFVIELNAEKHTHTHIYKYKNQIWLIHRFIIWHLASVIPSQDIIKYNFHGFTFGLVQIAKTLIDLRKNEQFFVFFCSQIHLSQFNSQIFITTWISTEYCYRTLIQRRKYRSHSNYLSTNVYNVYP